jgi:hypothetical protein
LNDLASLHTEAKPTPASVVDAIVAMNSLQGREVAVADWAPVRPVPNRVVNHVQCWSIVVGIVHRLGVPWAAAWVIGGAPCPAGK